MNADLVTLNPDSSRACLACSHAFPHSRGEYEDTHSRCTHFNETRIGCGDHGMLKSGKRKGEQHFSNKCANENVSPSSCFIAHNYCECSEEDRRIAELTSALERIIEEWDSVPGSIGSNEASWAGSEIYEIANKALALTSESSS